MAVCMRVCVYVGVGIIVLLRIVRDLYLNAHREINLFCSYLLLIFDMFIALAFVRSTYQHFLRQRPLKEPSMPLPHNYLPIFRGYLLLFQRYQIEFDFIESIFCSWIHSHTYTQRRARPAHRHMHLCMCRSRHSYVWICHSLPSSVQFFIRFEKCKWHLEEWEDDDEKEKKRRRKRTAK